MQTQLQISRDALSSQCIICNWACRRDAEATDFGTARSIETSLVAAATTLTSHEGELGMIEITYRQVVLGSFPVSDLDTASAAVADLIVERYDQMRGHV